MKISRLLIISSVCFLPLSCAAICKADFFRLIKANKNLELRTCVEQDETCLQYTDETGKTALFWAVIDNNADLVSFLADKGADVNFKDIMGNVPLSYAARYGRSECARILLKKGARVDETNRTESTPLMIACGRDGMGGSLELTQILLDHGAAVDGPKRSRLPLRMASRMGYADIVDFLMSRGATLPEEVAGREQLLRDAVKGGSTTLFNALKKSTRPLDQTLENGVTLLHMACMSSYGRAEIVRSLLDSGFVEYINTADSFGNCPIHYAVIGDNLPVAVTLIKKKALIDVMNQEGMSPLAIALQMGKREMVDLLENAGAVEREPKWPPLTGPYLGQAVPDVKPIVFALGIVAKNRNAHNVVAFSPDGLEAYWAEDGRIKCSVQKMGKWTVPEYTSFSPKGVWCDVPFVSPDNELLIFNSRRPVRVGSGDKKENIWMVRRTGSGWSDPVPFPDQINALQLHWQTSMDLAGTLYFSARRKDGFGSADIYCVRRCKSAYQKPENMGLSINSQRSETCPFISPDGSYLMFTRIDRNAQPQVSLYISYKKADGSWTEAHNLSDQIPFRQYALGSHVSGDGRYVFYLDDFGGNNTVYWFPADFIEARRPKTSRFRIRK